jgi:hypothetical protein
MGMGLQGLRDFLRGGGRARAVVSLLLLAFVLQIAVTRSHFHFGDTADATAVAMAQDASSDHVDGSSAPLQKPSHDESHCLLWHAAGVCGAAAPAVVAVLFIAKPTSTRIAVDERAIVPERFTAAWRSRAPPHALT